MGLQSKAKPSRIRPRNSSTESGGSAALSKGLHMGPLQPCHIPGQCLPRTETIRICVNKLNQALSQVPQRE